MPVLLYFLLLALASHFYSSVAFRSSAPHRRRVHVLLKKTTPRTTRILYGGSDGDKHDCRFDPNCNELEERLMQLRAGLLEQEYFQRPPNPAFSPQEFVTQVLRGLWTNQEPLPDSGFRLLLRSSTKYWREQLYKSVGAPSDYNAKEDVVVSALADAMGRPNNQFAILVGEGEEYNVAFPSEPLDYGDGVCWLECLGKKDNKLMAITGWTLKRRESDQAWLVDSIDWQDFRGQFWFVARSFILKGAHARASRNSILIHTTLFLLQKSFALVLGAKSGSVSVDKAMSITRDCRATRRTRWPHKTDLW
jgi:hypothetical protein